MNKLDNTFSRLLYRQANDSERQQLCRVRDALEIKNNDAVWLVLVALQHDQSKYEKFPSPIESASHDALAHFKHVADATAKGAQSTTAVPARARAGVPHDGAAATGDSALAAACALISSVDDKIPQPKGAGVLYQFSGDEFGRSVLHQRTSGRHGFAMPKLFTIRSLEHPSSGSWTFRFVDNHIPELEAATITNAMLCRIAIAQFLTAPLGGELHLVFPLDVTLSAFEGEIFNEQGVALTRRQLHSPRLS